MLFRLFVVITAVFATGSKPALAAEQRPAKMLFGMTSTPAPMAARAIGSYARGCLAGGVELPADGPAWQAMRPSRNRAWGTPVLVNFVEKLAKEAQAKDGWPGLLVGDLAQPRGGPMITGHASHQIGLDADIWLTPMPDRKLTRKEREQIAATSMLAADSLSVNPKVFTIAHAKLLRRAALDPQVARIFVHPAIKKALCDVADEIDPKDRSWLRMVRPWFGHYYHFHVRLDCPAGMSGCESQKAVPGGDGCGKEVESWLNRMRPKKPDPNAPKPKVTAKPKQKKQPLTLAQLPTACTTVLAAGYPDGLKRFNIDLAADIEAPVRNPRRVAALAAATPSATPGISTEPAAAAAAPASTAQETTKVAPAQVIPGMAAAQRFTGGFSSGAAKAARPQAQAQETPVPPSPQ